MDPLSGVVAALALLECLGKSLFQAKKAYDKIKAVDKERRDMETMMDITTTQIKTLSGFIETSPPDAPVRNSPELARTLKVCTSALGELTTISKRIWDNRDTCNFHAIRCCSRLERRKDQIHKLRSTIKKCIQALELPTLFGKIDHFQRDTERGMRRMEDRLGEVTEYLKSMPQTQQLHRLTPSPQPEAPMNLESVLVQIKQDVDTLFEQHRSDSRLPHAPAALLYGRVVSALDTIHHEVTKMTGDSNNDLNRTNPEESETDLKVRIMADEAELAIKDLNASDLSTGCMPGSKSPTSSPQDFDSYTEKNLPPEKRMDGSVDQIKPIDPICSQCARSTRNIMDWRETCHTNDTQSSADATTEFDDGSTSATLRHGRSSPVTDVTSATDYIDVHDVNQEQVDIVESMMLKKKYREAVEYLKDIFRGARNRRECLSQPLLPYFANAICNAELNGKEARKACEVAPDVEPLLDAARLEKAKALLSRGEFRRINLLLASYEIVSTSALEKGFQLDAVQIQLRLIRCLTLVRFGASATALDILQMLLRSQGLCKAQRGYANYYAAEAYYLQAYLDTESFEYNLEKAKELCSTACNIFRRSPNIAPKSLIGCILLMIQVDSEVSPEHGVKLWKGRLADLRRKQTNSQRNSIQPKPHGPPSDATQRFSDLLNKMMEQGKSDIQAAADLVIEDLKQNYEVDALCPKWYDTSRDRPPIICFCCIRNSIMTLIKFGSVTPPQSIHHDLCSRHQQTENWQEFHGYNNPPETLLGPRHRSDSGRENKNAATFVPCFNLLSFLVMADPIHSELRADNVSGCAGEIKALFEFGNLEHEGIRKIVNTPVPIPALENSTSSDKSMNISRTPVWLAACFGQKQVVKYFLSLGVVDNSQFSYEGLLRYPPCYPQGMAIASKINDALVALVSAIPESRAADLLGAAHTLWSWDRLPVFDALLSKAGSKILNSQLAMTIPYLEDSTWVVRSVNMHVVHCLVQFWINTPIQPSRVLPILKRREANFHEKYKGRRAIDIARSLAKTHFQRYDPPASRLIEAKPLPLTAEWHRRTLQHIKTVQYLVYANSDDFTDVSDDFQAEIQGTVSRLHASLDVDNEDDAYSEMSHDLQDAYFGN